MTSYFQVFRKSQFRYVALEDAYSACTLAVSQTGFDFECSGVYIDIPNTDNVPRVQESQMLYCLWEWPKDNCIWR